MDIEHFKDLPVASVLAVTTIYGMHSGIDPTIIMVGVIGLVFVTLSKILRNGK